MTLGTADADGRPWVSSVFFAAAPGWRELYWISSRRRPTRATGPPGPSWTAASRSTRARPACAPGPGPRPPEDVLAPSLYRLYRAAVSQHWVLDPDLAPDQRTTVSP
jgi:hypothetical protein